MAGSSLIEILQKLSPKEIKLLGAYLNSPLFNTNKNITKLYDYLIKNINKKESFDKKKMFSRLFHEKPYNDNFMRKLISDLNRCTESFLSFKNFSEDEFGKKKYLLEAFYGRNLYKPFEKLLKNTLGNIEKTGELKKGQFYYQKYILEHINNYYLLKLPRPFLKPKELRIGELENESNYLAAFFIISAMRRYLYLLNETLLYPAEFNMVFYKEVQKYAQTLPFKNIPLIKFYDKFIKLLNGKYTEENYIYVRKFLFENPQAFEKDELYTHFTILANVNIVGARANNNEESFSLYKFMIENNISLQGDENVIGETKFTAIALAAAGLDKTEWLKWFINNFKNKIPEKVRDNTVNYCLSLFYYRIGDNKKTLFYLKKVKQDKLFSKLRVKSLLIRVYYELGQYQESLDEIDNFRHFISSSRFLTKDFAKKYGKFIKLTRRLAKIKSGTSRENITDLKFDAVTGDEYLADQWLKSKIEEIEKNS